MIVRVRNRAPVQWNVNLFKFVFLIHAHQKYVTVMHSSAIRVLYAFDQTPSLHVRERELAREPNCRLVPWLSQGSPAEPYPEH